MDRSGMVYVDPTMCDTAQEMADGLGTLAVNAKDDLPQPHGILIRGRPRVPVDPDDGIAWTTRGRWPIRHGRHRPTPANPHRGRGVLFVRRDRP